MALVFQAISPSYYFFDRLLFLNQYPSSPSVTYLSLRHPPFLPLFSVNHLSKPQ
ncbi:hypothetical protein LguiB_010613 [Lonicera macranthoides]